MQDDVFGEGWHLQLVEVGGWEMVDVGLLDPHDDAGQVVAHAVVSVGGGEPGDGGEDGENKQDGSEE